MIVTFQILIALLIGILVGLTGTGGAFVIPTLIYLFGFEQLRAQGTALLVSVFPIWVISFIPYYRAQNFDFKIGLLMALGIAAGSYFGGTWAQHLSAVALRRILGVVLVVVGARFVLGR
jgi:uncharacterized membrane protein YfcA